MKIFCSRCGREKELEETARGAFVTCAGCGNRFSAEGAAPAPSGTSTGVIIGIALVVMVPVVVAIIGILAAIAIPNFIRFQSRSKQSECKSNLKALAAAEKAYFESHGQLSTQLRELGFEPERGNRYAYFAGGGTMQRRDAQASAGAETDAQIGVDRFRYPSAAELTQRDLPSGLNVGLAGCPDCFAIAACAGNIDSDSTLDVWSVATVARTGPSGEPIPALVPFNDVNDVSE